MDCREARESIHAACDSELKSPETQDLACHLSQCRGCAAYELMAKSLKTRIRASAVFPDLSVAEAILEKVTRSPVAGFRGFLPAGFFRPGVFQAVAAAVLVAVVVFGAIFVLTPAQSMASIAVRHHRLRLVGRLVLETHANCCKDLEQWFEAHSGRPVRIPDITYPGIIVEGGKHYRHSTGNSMFIAAYSLGGKPITVCVCTGPNMGLGEGKPFTLHSRSGTVETAPDYTLISWRSGEMVNALITPFDEATSMEILAAIR